MHGSLDSHEDGALKPLTEREALELLAEERPLATPHAQSAATEKRLRASLDSEHGVTWIRISDLLSSGTGRLAGRGIDFEAELARRLRHPVDTTRRVIQDHRASLPPLDAFGRSRSRTSRDTIGRS